jgi:hypothetical protein
MSYTSTAATDTVSWTSYNLPATAALFEPIFWTWELAPEEKSKHGHAKGKLKQHPPKPSRGFKHLVSQGRGSYRFGFQGRRGQ